MSNEKKPEHEFTVHNIFIKDFSFEAPNTPLIFKCEWKPHTEFDIKMDFKNLDKGVYEAILKIMVTVGLTNPNKDEFKDMAVSDDKKNIIAFLTEVEQAGIFTIAGFTEQETEHMALTACQSILFPYARERISSAILNGGFPQLILPPVNFENMYIQSMKERESKTSSNA